MKLSELFIFLFYTFSILTFNLKLYKRIFGKKNVLVLFLVEYINERIEFYLQLLHINIIKNYLKT